MKLSDKALRQIARKLFDRHGFSSRQAAAEMPVKAGRCLRGPKPRLPERQARATVLNFKKRLR